MMNTIFRVGDWRVDPASGRISRNGETAQLDLRAMDLLLFLAEHAGEIVSIESLLDQIWNGVAVTPDSVYQSVMSLRRLLGDDAKQPRYIATVPRRGYRMIATVAPCDDAIPPAPDVHVIGAPEHPAPVDRHIPGRTSHRGTGFLLALCAVAGVGLGMSVWLVLFHGKTASTGPQGAAFSTPPLQSSVGVLPFLDLTEGMKQGEFTDGMTEELIDQLSKIPGLRVPSPTSSFYFRDKQIPVSDVANKLGVAYVLDGSVRKSGSRVRVAARLVRADTGYVLWAETYDRPWRYTVMVQDEIAEKLTKAVKISLEKAEAH